MNLEQVRADPLYSKILELDGETAVSEAGWFDEDAPYLPKEHPSPVGLTHTSMAVLFTSGAFAPLHEGHVQMMTQAAAYWHNNFGRVRHKIIVPDHDSYLRHKGLPEWNIEERMSRMGAAADHNILVDHTFATTEPCARNISKIYAYYRQIMPLAQLVYVCGADNWQLAKAFAYEGRVLVVGRPGFSLPEESGNLRVTSMSVNQSSTNIREQIQIVPTRPSQLILRHEGENHCDSLPHPCPDYRAFANGLQALLSAEFEGRVLVKHLSDQKVEAGVAINAQNVISLDPLISCRYNVRTSRRFLPGGWIRRGRVPWNADFSTLEPGNYVLFDDDSHTGNTLREVTAEIEERHSNVHITSTHVLSYPSSSEYQTEILDIRDFLFGAPHGGLASSWALRLARFPYVYPFVSPTARASVRTDRAMRFSYDVWKLNQLFWQHSDARLFDLDSTKALLIETGYDNMLIADFCEKQMEICKRAMT